MCKYSPECQCKLEACEDKVNEDQSSVRKAEVPRRKFKPLCETRWVEHHTALEDFCYLYEPNSNCMEQMCYPVTDEDKQWPIDTKTKIETAGLLKDIQLSEFVEFFYTSHYFFAYKKEVAKKLQGPSKDVH